MTDFKAFTWTFPLKFANYKWFFVSKDLYLYKCNFCVILLCSRGFSMISTRLWPARRKVMELINAPLTDWIYDLALPFSKLSEKLSLELIYICNGNILSHTIFTAKSRSLISIITYCNFIITCTCHCSIPSR